MARGRRHMTSFVGRTDELADLRAALGRSRLVTVSGPGGIGKSRLVDEVLSEMREAIVAHLEGTRDEAGVVATVAAALSVHQPPGVEMREALKAHLADRNLLLVLDPCEHVLDAASDLVQDLLAECPELRLLVVSRQPLGLDAESVRRVRPLPIAEAVRLLTERGRLVDPELADVAGDPLAAELCRRLDGAPLAIELAAARLEVLSPGELLERLGHRFELLRRGEQSLLATVAWSYDLLAEPERSLFRRLSVFAETFDLAAAEAVAGADLDRLQALVAKSLVQVVEHGGGRTRFRLLDMLRDFAALRLVEEGEAEARLERLSEWIAAFVKDTYPPALSIALHVSLVAHHHADLVHRQTNSLTV